MTCQPFLASSADILFSFLLLARMMTVLRISGQAPGWGIQCQNGGFLFLMVRVMFLFSASLRDLIHFRLPFRLNSRLATLWGEWVDGSLRPKPVSVKQCIGKKSSPHALALLQQ